MMSNGAVLGLTLLFLIIIGVLVYFLVSKKECNTGEYKNDDGSCTACPCINSPSNTSIVSCLKNTLGDQFPTCDFDKIGESFNQIESSIDSFIQCIEGLKESTCGDGGENISKILSTFKSTVVNSLNIKRLNITNIEQALQKITQAAVQAVDKLSNCDETFNTCLNELTDAKTALENAIDTFEKCLNPLSNS